MGVVYVRVPLTQVLFADRVGERNRTFQTVHAVDLSMSNTGNEAEHVSSSSFDFS